MKNMSKKVIKLPIILIILVFIVSIYLINEYNIVASSKEGPIIDNVTEITCNTKFNSSTWYNNNLILTIEVTGTGLMDEIMQPKKIKYQWSSTKDIPSEYTHEASASLSTSGPNKLIYSIYPGISKPSDGTNYLHVKYTNDLNVVKTAFFGPIKFDMTNPTAGTITMKLGSETGDIYDGKTWTNRNVYCILSKGKDEQSGTRVTYFCIDNGKKNFNTATISDSGEHEIKVTTADTAGNTATRTYTAKIDIENPKAATMKMTQSDGTTYTSGKWTNSQVTVHLNSDATDQYSGVKKSYFGIKSSTGSVLAVGQAIDKTLNKDGEYAVTVTTIDNVANVGTGEYIVKIDTVSPTLKLTSKQNLDDSKKITATATDELSGISKIQYSKDGKEWKDWTKSGTASKDVKKSEFETFYARAIDNAGNISNVEKVVLGTSGGGSGGGSGSSGSNDDTTPPKCTIKAYAEEAYVDKNLINVEEPTNASTIIYTFKFNEDIKDFTADDIIVTNGTKGEFTEKTEKREYTLVVENTESCIQKVNIEEGVCTDTAGNKNKEASISINIDREAPTCVITASESSPTNASNITYTFTFSEAITGFASADITVKNGKKVKFTKISEKEFTQEITNTGSGIQEVSIAKGSCQDLAWNNVEEAKISIIIDRTAPEITVNPSRATNVKNVKITIVAGDIGGSGLETTNEYVYQLGTSNSEVPTGKWENYTDGKAFTVGENLNGTYYLWIKAITDKVGNISTVNDGKTVDGYHILGPYKFKNVVPGANIVEKIEISKMPNKTTYNAHEKFDATGLQVIATYTNGETKELNANEYKIIDVPDLTCKINKIEIQYTEDVEIKTEIPITVGHEEIVDKGKNPTCTEKGLTEGKHCEICKEVLVKQEEIKELGHSFTKYVSNNDATCEKDGTKTAKCDRCEEKNTVVDEGSKKQHNYKDGECTYCGKKSTLEVTSSKYIIGTYITKIQPKTTAKTLKANIETNATQIKVYDKDKKILENDNLIGTGMTIEFKLGTQTITYTLVISGDANGDGKADFKDLTTVNLSRLNKKTIQGAYKLAADVNGDGKVDFKDVLKINKYRLNKIKEI